MIADKGCLARKINDQQFLREELWILVLVLDSKEKKVSSRNGMNLSTLTSKLLEARVPEVEKTY